MRPCDRKSIQSRGDRGHEKPNSEYRIQNSEHVLGLLTLTALRAPHSALRTPRAALRTSSVSTERDGAPARPHDPTHLYLLAEIAFVFGYRT
jgi:hypothetical protein